MEDRLKRYRSEVEAEVRQNILDFWMKYTRDEKNEGFYGFITNDLTVHSTADKGLVLYARILWSFSMAYRQLKEEKYLLIAQRAYDYLLAHFIDEEFSGAYWMVDYKGKVVDSKKQVYGVAFCIYAFVEYYRAAVEKKSLDMAVALYHVLEEKSRDQKNGGYFEAFSREWRPLDNMSLSEKDMNCAKSMNTHLHVMEAYTNLLRVRKDGQVETSLRELIHITTDRIVNADTKQFQLFFDSEWNSLAPTVSYGHDIEGSWLLYEAAEVLGDEELLAKVEPLVLAMAQKVYDDGMDKTHGGLFNEVNGSHVDTDKIWWVQAEAMVGFLNAYQLSGKEYFLEASFNVWEFCRKYIIDKRHGEWFWKTYADGTASTETEKVGPWKCPYHNSRACFEVIKRMDALLYKFREGFSGNEPDFRGLE